jgi:signal transduction histidine kinase
MKGAGTITVSTANVMSGGEEGGPGRGHVLLTVSDTGVGMDADTLARIFEPFFTTKPVGEGTGLGISISHDIVVKQHAGLVEVATRPGEFTEFRIVLPRAAASLAAGAPA